MGSNNSGLVLGKTISEWVNQYPLLEDMIKTNEVFWLNPNMIEFDQAIKEVPLSIQDVLNAETTLNKFAPYISKAFPETASSQGIIESPLVDIHHMQNSLQNLYNCSFRGKFFIKVR